MKWKYYLIPITVLFFTLTGAAQDIIRGPYLQQGTPTSMIIRWRTNAPSSSKVWYGANPANLNSNLYQADAKTEHEVKISGLTPNTTYYYAVGDETAPMVGADDNHYFTTSPSHGVVKPVSIWVLGDAGKRTANQRAVRDAFYSFNGSPHTDLILLLGDNAYNSGTDAEYQEALFEDMYESSLVNSVIWPTIGNHDALSADSDNESGPYYDIFNCPKNGEAGGVASGTEAWYSFDYANIHFISLNTEDVDYGAASPMLAWLQEDLEKTKQEWIVAFFHKQPYYTVSDFRTNFVPVLEAGGVDLVMYGHRHIYRRSVLMNGHYGDSGSFDPTTMVVNAGDGRIDGDGAYEKPPGITPNGGTVYLVSGSAGSVSSINTSYPFSSFELGHPELGSTSISVAGSQMDVQFINQDGVVRDYFTISKGSATLPNVSVSSPEDGTSYAAPQALTIQADASDPDGQISRVEFFANGNAIGADNSAPFALDWNIPAKGFYDLHAQATDNDGNIVQSRTVTIEVGVFNACSSIILSGDDAEQSKTSGNMKLTSSDLELGVESSQIVGMRFQNLNLPKNAQIISADIQFVVDEAVGINPCTLIVYGEASPNSAPFINTSYELSNRPRTQAEVAWSPEYWTQTGEAGPDQRVSLRSVLQEIVNQEGFTTNSALTIMIEGEGSRIAQSFDKNPANAPQLCVTFANNETDYDCAEIGANIGDPCDDGDVCTINDVVQADCGCAGSLAADGDDDGTCDALDLCPGVAEPGSPCDDGNSSTYDDVIIDNCNCRGTPIPFSAVIESRLMDHNDDVEETIANGDVSLISSDLELGYEFMNAQLVGLRFTNLVLPQGSNITNAYIQFTLDEASTGTASMLIRGEDIDDAPAFADEVFNASSRTTTSASANWSVPDWNTGEADGPAQRTVNIAHIVQEIVDRPGWKVQNSMAFLISGFGTRTAKSYDGNSAYAPVLVIEYNNTPDCSGVTGLTPGMVCDDNDPCTENDAYDANCNCVGVLKDADNDGVCDSEDVCPGGDDRMDSDRDGRPDACDSCPNSPTDDSDGDGVCDDVDRCPGGDDTIDTDGDGRPDACDACNATLIGSECDDGNPNTVDDVIDENCNCAGTPTSVNTLDIRIDDGNDDVEEREGNGGIYFTSPDLELVYLRGNQTVGLRFNNVSIPNGAFIGQAYVQFTVDETSSGSTRLLIQGEAADNGFPFERQSYDVSSRPRTNAAVEWNPSPWTNVGARGVGQRTTDIAPIIQEIVRRPGWQNGNSIVIIITGTGERTAESYDGAPGEGPALHIEYFSGGSSCPNAGDECDDGNPCTVDDVYDEDCNCAGEYVEGEQPPGCEDPCSLLIFDDFENGWGNWNKGGNDAQLSGRFPLLGRRNVRIRDNSGSASSFFSNDLDLSPFETAEVSFSYYAFSMDNPREDFWLQISTDGGRIYRTVAEWAAFSDFRNGRWYDDRVVVEGVDFTANTRFRFVCDASTNLDHIYIDNITIIGCLDLGGENNTAARLSDGEEATNLPLEQRRPLPEDITGNFLTNDFKVSVKPNPFQNEFYLFVQKPTPERQVAAVRIMDVNGRMIYQQNNVPLEQDYLIIPQNGWPEGVYFVRVQSGEYVQTLKLIKQ